MEIWDILVDAQSKIYFFFFISKFQTPHFAADHIGYVGQRCRQCQSTVRLLHMGKYCVRFGSDIYQFCSNTCLERYKVNIQVCCYCQKNLLEVPANEQRQIIAINNNKVCFFFVCSYPSANCEVAWFIVIFLRFLIKCFPYIKLELCSTAASNARYIIYLWSSPILMTWSINLA